MGHPVGRGDHTPPGVPMKIGGFRISPPDPLETTKGRAAALPLETIPGLRGIPEDGRGRFAARGYGGRWDEGRKMEALVPAVIPGPCLVEDEGNDSLVDLEPALGVRRLWPL